MNPLIPSQRFNERIPNKQVTIRPFAVSGTRTRVTYPELTLLHAYRTEMKSKAILPPNIKYKSALTNLSSFVAGDSAQRKLPQKHSCNLRQETCADPRSHNARVLSSWPPIHAFSCCTCLGTRLPSSNVAVWCPFIVHIYCKSRVHKCSLISWMLYMAKIH